MRARRQRRLQLLDRHLVQILVEQHQALPICNDQLLVRFFVGPTKFAGTLKNKLPTRCRQFAAWRPLLERDALNEVSRALLVCVKKPRN